MRTQVPLTQITKILMMVVALVAVLMMRKSCASGVAGWFNTVAPTPAPAPPDGSRKSEPPVLERR